MKNKRGRPIGATSKRNSAKVIFRERWNRAFAKLTEGEVKRYASIIQTTRTFCGLEQLPSRQIYLVRKGQNNKNMDVLMALEEYVDLK